jgi:aspartyl/asparaginyl beta-hydroxylase (cupin superfamily)
VGVLTRLVEAHPELPVAAIWLARLLNQGGSGVRAERVLREALVHQPQDPQLHVDLAVLLGEERQPHAAASLLESHLHQVPENLMGWLLLSQLAADIGRFSQSLHAALEAVTRAQAQGSWTSPSTTPEHLRPLVARAVSQVREGRPALFHHAVDELKRLHPGDSLQRVERAVAGYLGEMDVRPPHPRQRPLALYIPDLPEQPFLDPQLQPWAPRLLQAYQAIRQEALGLLAEDTGFEDFVRLRPGDRMDRYLQGPTPSWEAYFFYRHGERYDEHHARCPATSATLESLELFRVPGQAPEICFSVLKPRTEILPHHGVCNARVVMHLPLLVPPHCALNLVDIEARSWREGELLMFDDTYLHSAWNRSDSLRIILLMDCWNPHLTSAERDGVARITQLIGTLDFLFSDEGWADGG